MNHFIAMICFCYPCALCNRVGHYLIWTGRYLLFFYIICDLSCAPFDIYPVKDSAGGPALRRAVARPREHHQRHVRALPDRLLPQPEAWHGCSTQCHGKVSQEFLTYESCVYFRSKESNST